MLRWAVDTSSWTPGPDEFEFLLALIPTADQAECRSFRFLDDRKRALVSRLLQRAAACAALGLPFSEVDIRRTKGRKPFVFNRGADRSSAPNFNFNVSHEVGSRGLGVACLWVSQERVAVSLSNRNETAIGV